MARRTNLSTIRKLRNKYLETGEVHDKPGICPQRKTTEREDIHVIMTQKSLTRSIAAVVLVRHMKRDLISSTPRLYLPFYGV